MKREIIGAAFILLTAVACKDNKDKKDDAATNEDSVTNTNNTTSETPSEKNAAPAVTVDFDVEKIAVAPDLTGEFPYMKLPAGYTITDPDKYGGKGETKDLDKEYFYYQGVLMPREGKTFKGDIRADSDNFKDKKFSKLEIKKHFDTWLSGIGGVKINDGVALKEGENKRIEELDRNAYSDGYRHSGHNYDDVHSYVVKTKDKLVFVQYNLGSDGAKITVLE